MLLFKQNLGMKFTIFLVFWLLVNFIDVSILLCDISLQMLIKMCIYHILQLQIMNQVFSSDFRKQFNLVIMWITQQKYIAAYGYLPLIRMFSFLKNTFEWIFQQKLVQKSCTFSRLFRYDNFNNKNSSCKSGKRKNEFLKCSPWNYFFHYNQVIFKSVR